MRVETLFWIVVVVLSCLFLLYRHMNRRRLNRALGKLPEIYDAVRASFLSGSRAVPDSSLPRHAMLGTLEAISETRGGPPPAFADLSKRERRFVELLHATTCMSDREFERTLAQLSKQEQKTFQQLRDIYSGPPPRKSYTRLMIDRVAAYRRARREAKLAAESQRRYDAYWAQFVFWEVHDILQWLKTDAPRDPDMWHLLPDLNWDYPELYDVLLWVVTQPECDAATAINILHLMNPDVAMDQASGGKFWPVYGNVDPAESAEVKLLAMIGTRSEQAGFVRNELLPDQMCTNEDNAGLLAMILRERQRIEEAGRSVPFPLPVKLLSKPVLETGRIPATSYEAHDDRLILTKSESLQAV